MALLQENAELVDAGLVEAMGLVAQRMEEAGDRLWVEQPGKGAGSVLSGRVGESCDRSKWQWGEETDGHRPSRASVGLAGRSR